MSVTKVTDAMRNVTQVDAAKITTGTIPDARIPASAVTQHVTATDLTAVHQAIATLGLHTAVSDNKAAFNLPNAFIDTFEDDTGITTETDVDRVTSGEYVASFYSSEGAETEWDYVTNNVAMVDKSGGTTMTSNSYALGSSSAPSWFADLWGTLTSGSQATLWNNPSTGYATGFTTDFGANYTFSKFSVGKARSYGDVSTFRIRYSDDGTNWTVLDMTGASVDSYHGGTSPLPPSGGGEVTNFDSTGVMDWELTGQGDRSVAAIISGFTQFSARYLAFEIGTWSANGNSNVGFSNWRWWYKPISTVASATGSFTSTAIVPQDATNKSSVGLVVLYKDNGSSSCTLNTDIVAKVRANTGQAYQTLVLASAGTYSDSLKIAIAPAIAVTAGQALSYEISFANQASSSKEARIYGVAMTY